MTTRKNYERSLPFKMAMNTSLEEWTRDDEDTFTTTLKNGATVQICACDVFSVGGSGQLPAKIYLSIDEELICGFEYSTGSLSENIPQSVSEALGGPNEVEAKFWHLKDHLDRED